MSSILILPIKVFLPNLLDAKQVLIVLTDGQSGGRVDQPAQQLKGIGVTIFSIGVGSGIRVQELETIASSSVNEHVYLLANFNELSALAEKMSSSTCNGTINYLQLIYCYRGKQ